MHFTIQVDCSVTYCYYSAMNKKSKSQNNNPIIAQADIAVIGGGVVGCAVARKMALDGAKVVLLEKAPDILAGASKGNSAILHTGFDAPPNSLEQQCVNRGYREYLEIRKDFNLPVLTTGALLAAWTTEEEDKFEKILKKAKKNGVNDLRVITRTEALSLEPNLSQDIKSAITVPREYVIDPWSAPLAYLTQAVENGGQALFNAEVRDGNFGDGTWTLNTTRGRVRTKFVVNCAGLYGDLVDQNLRGDSKFTIHPRKGQFVVYDKAAAELLSSIILPIPTERTKGIVLFPTIFGNIVVGPTAEEQESRDDASVDREILLSLADRAAQMIPALAQMPVTATYAGIRPATEKPHYRIRHDREYNWITLGGIRSTGLTGALGLACHVSELLSTRNHGFTPLEKPIQPALPNLAEHLPRDYTAPGYGEIVCHCEMVTQREILAAMDSTVPPGNLGGLKRRTRATMGRCQGFYCSARLAELTKGKIDPPMASGDSND